MAKILVIDDDQAMRKFISISLGSLRHKIFEAASGIQGLSIAAREIPNLIICDYMMPEMNGLETLQLIRKEKSLNDVPVIIITVETDRQTIMDFLNLGISYYFAKPIDFMALKKKVQQVLEFEDNRKKNQKLLLQTKMEHEELFNKPLLVTCEPNRKLRTRLVKALENNFRLINTTDGASCLNAILANHPAAVLMETNINFLSPFAVAERIKSVSEYEKTKILVFSSRRNEEKISRHSEIIDGIIEKPYSAKNLLESLTEVLDQYRYQVLESEKALLIKFNAGCLKWLAENYDEEIEKIDTILLDMFEAGKTFLVIDMAKTGEEEKDYAFFIEDIVDKASIQDLSVTIITILDNLQFNIMKKGYENVILTKPVRADVLNTDSVPPAVARSR